MTDVLAQASALVAVEATLLNLEKQLDQTRHALSALVGQFRGERADADYKLDELRLPTQLPLIVPFASVLMCWQRRRNCTQRLLLWGWRSLTCCADIADGGPGWRCHPVRPIVRDGQHVVGRGATLSQTLFAGAALVHSLGGRWWHPI